MPKLREHAKELMQHAKAYKPPPPENILTFRTRNVVYSGSSAYAPYLTHAIDANTPGWTASDSLVLAPLRVFSTDACAWGGTQHAVLETHQFSKRVELFVRLVDLQLGPVISQNIIDILQT